MCYSVLQCGSLYHKTLLPHAHIAVRHDSVICMTWLSDMCNVIHSYVWKDSVICVTFNPGIRISSSTITACLDHTVRRQCVVVCSILLQRVAVWTPSLSKTSTACPDRFETWHIHMCDMTHSYIWHDFIKHCHHRAPIPLVVLCCSVLKKIAVCCAFVYGVATISRLLKIIKSLLQNIVSFIRLFCKRDLSFYLLMVATPYLQFASVHHYHPLIQTSQNSAWQSFYQISRSVFLFNGKAIYT